jgi:hypothetical protein
VGALIAKNDRILLDGIVDDRVSSKLPSSERSEAFEYLACEQILKDFDLASDEILSGLVDGRQDGGIDGFFILVNGHMMQDPESFTWPRAGSELKVYLVSCKHHDTFRQATLDSLIATLAEFLNFGIEGKDLKGAYSPPLLRMRSNLYFAYRRLSPRLTSFSIDVCYASRGDTGEIGTEVRSRGIQIESLIKDCFGKCSTVFRFIGCTELVELHRKVPNYTLELPFVEALAKGERYVILARLSDYHAFVSDGGRLRRYLFDSNVRDFMGLNRVNEDIKVSLENPTSADFWWLNNGVTVLATSASIVGKSIQMNDIQIVNGLQTTESIFRHFDAKPGSQDDRCLLVKVIVSREEAVRDAIIRATNNQTDVELASLHATDKIQRDIEDILLRHGLFYERRKNYYVNQGHTLAEVVTPLYAAAGCVSLLLKLPHKAARLRSKFMRSPISYQEVFSDRIPLDAWPKICQIHKRVDAELEKLRPKARGQEKFLKGWRYLISFLLVAARAKRFSFSAADLVVLEPGSISSVEVEGIWHDLSRAGNSCPQPGGWTSMQNVLHACSLFAVQRDIAGFNSLGHGAGNFLDDKKVRGRRAPAIDEEFLMKVRIALPPQPWKPGMHLKVAEQLGCGGAALAAAIERLVEDEVLCTQRNGVLYDLDGNVVAFDPDRVDPDTLELRG